MQIKTIVTALVLPLLFQTGAARRHGHARHRFRSLIPATGSTSAQNATVTPVASFKCPDAGVSSPGPSDPVITIINKDSIEHTYIVERGSNSGPGAWEGGPVKVPAGGTVNFYPGAGFIGALTGPNGGGTRFEPNFAEGTTWYDADMEMGMSDATFGPTESSDPEKITGEKDCVGKANRAWSKLDPSSQKALLDSGYLEGTVGGSLKSVQMDKAAPQCVIDFLQQTAAFNAYITHGSVGGVDATLSDAIANTHTKSVQSNKFTLISYK
ncbi:MAG: hypothetical protein M1825_003770 [Sarcosagium campestre]|nr:MAG: hypothetical protein M1825_003770 [Sarcosagium campestre]